MCKTVSRASAFQLYSTVGEKDPAPRWARLVVIDLANHRLPEGVPLLARAEDQRQTRQVDYARLDSQLSSN